jgi:hypothetical protein
MNNELIHGKLLNMVSRNVRGDLMVWTPVERMWVARQPLRIDRAIFVVKRGVLHVFFN